MQFECYENLQTTSGDGLVCVRISAMIDHVYSSDS